MALAVNKKSSTCYILYTRHCQHRQSQVEGHPSTPLADSTEKKNIVFRCALPVKREGKKKGATWPKKTCFKSQAKCGQLDSSTQPLLRDRRLIHPIVPPERTNSTKSVATQHLHSHDRFTKRQYNFMRDYIQTVCTKKKEANKPKRKR